MFDWGMRRVGINAFKGKFVREYMILGRYVIDAFDMNMNFPQKVIVNISCIEDTQYVQFLALNTGFKKQKLVYKCV
jgi:hypothetical protein